MHLLRITSRLLLFLCFSTHAVCADSPVASEKPNIVFFLVDDLGYGDLGYSGSQLAETPHLDAFAENNLIFSSAYASSPHCSPTRASIVTGQYPARLHITVWIGGNKATTYEGMELPRQKQFLEADIPTVAEYLKGQGYVTAQIGKWHIGGLVVPITEHGFDEVIGYAPGPVLEPRTAGMRPISPFVISMDQKGSISRTALPMRQLSLSRVRREPPFSCSCSTTMFMRP
jgi:arylsulfatase A-like enzyme